MNLFAMARRFFALLALLLFLPALQGGAQETHCFATRDTCSLYLDIWRPAPGAPTSIGEVQKPTILFVFGGGFIMGKRNDPFHTPWFNTLTADGYTVVAIDYRLGMKGVQVGKGLSGMFRASDAFYQAQQMGVEDVFSAVRFLSDHPELGIDPGNIVLSGSSAGAIISLASAYDIACGRTGELPEGFAFKGVMSFAGAIISKNGAPKFPKAPCPLLLLHGTADQAVAYNHFGAMGRGIWGSSYLAGQLQKKGWDCCIYRFKDRTHDVAAYMAYLWNLEKEFLEKSVMQGVHRSIDAQVDDPSLPSWGAISLNDIYK